MATILKKPRRKLKLPDEVLMDILLRLPLRSLQLFKSVSKHWFSLIASENFTRRLREPRIDAPCGLFIKHKGIDFEEYYEFVTLGPKVTSLPLRVVARCKLGIMQSCNGLVLCSGTTVSSMHHYYVYNPFTEKIKDIPVAWRPPITNMILAFDPTKSPYYKVILTEKTWNHTGRKIVEANSYAEQMHIYSSETDKWRICGPPFQGDTFSGLDDGVYWNNAIHWIHRDDKSHCKLDIVDHNPIVTKIQTPALDKYEYWDHRYTKLFESCGSMLLLMREYRRCRYHVFEMREESSEWLAKYIIDDLHNIVPLKWIPSRYHYNPFLCIVLGERGDDSFMVIESDKNIVRYNFVSKTVSTLFNFLSSDTCRYSMPVPFIASLARV